MWLFRKRTSLAGSGIFQGFTDWHCHLLPGVDDGVQTMEESLQILSLYEELGVKEVWLTPHIMEDMPNTTAALKVRFEELKAVYQGNITLHLASENMLDSLFEERLEKNDLLPLGKDRKHLLVETSYFNPPMGLSNILLRIKSKGYTPVLAHPERYNYMDEDDYRQLKEMNVKFQLNLFSLVGAHGIEVRKKAEWLLKNGFYDLTGSDTHGLAVLEANIYKKKFCKPTMNKCAKLICCNRETYSVVPRSAHTAIRRISSASMHSIRNGWKIPFSLTFG